MKLPEQKKGAKHDAIAHRCVDSVQEAIIYYEQVRKQLENINSWGQVMKTATLHVVHIEQHLNKKVSPPEPGDYIGIKLGMKNTTGKGYDWVRIVALEKTSVSLEFMVSPTVNPYEESRSIAHFYKSTATNTFRIALEDCCIWAGVHGRNERTNISQGLFGSIRNILVSSGGMLGLGKVQWQFFVDSLLGAD